MIESSLVQNISLLKNLSKTWVIKDFSDVVYDNSGGNKKLAKTEFLESGEIAIVDQGKELIAGYCDNLNFAVKTKPPYIVFGDHTRIFKFIDFPFVMGADGTKVLQPKDNNCFTKYLYYFFLSINIPETGYNRHFKYLKELQIPLPLLEQQKKIASILDNADTYRQKTKALIAKYDELTQSLFLDMFGDPVKNEKGWEKVELKKICSFKKKNIKPENIKEGENYVALDSIEKVTGKITTVYNVNKGELKSNKFWFDNSYILYGKLRPYLNKVALPNFDGVCSTDIIPIQPIQNKSNRLFITSILRHSSFVAFADERSSGANLPRISPSEVEKYSTINPPLKLQNQFAERVQAIEEQKAQAQASLEKAEELFNSLLQRAFNGEL
jgi:type I restriction enzyme S subunit